MPWVPECVGFCVCPLRVESLFPTALWLWESKPCWLLKSNALGAYLPGAGPLVGEFLDPWGEPLQLQLSSYLVVVYLGLWV